MGLKSVQGQAETLIFECIKCKRIESPQPERTIDISDLSLKVEAKNVFINLPVCPTCGAISAIFFVSGEAKVEGPISHLRAILLKRVYELEGGDANEDLAQVKAVLAKIETSYADSCTEEARQEFLGSKNFEKLDKFDKPLKEEKKENKDEKE